MLQPIIATAPIRLGLRLREVSIASLPFHDSTAMRTLLRSPDLTLVPASQGIETGTGGVYHASIFRHASREICA